MHLDARKTTLPPGPIGIWGWKLSEGRPAPDDNWKVSLVVRTEDYAANNVAFRLVRALYAWFGHSDEDIPYVTVEGDTKMIDAAQIASLR
jgi:hypothetical protein